VHPPTDSSRRAPSLPHRRALGLPHRQALSLSKGCVLSLSKGCVLSLSKGPLLLTLLLALLLTALPAAAAARHDQGERVEVTGVVTDEAGQPLPEVRVVLEASRAVFSFRQFHRVLRDTRRVAGVSDAKGQFTLTWPWDGYFNDFQLVAGVPVRTPNGERFEELARTDVSARIKQSNPLVVTLAVQNAEFVRTLRAFLASVKSDDERRVYQQMGKPDRVEDRGRERTWWYFEQGRAYRFRDGTMVEVKPFDPVEKL